MACCGLANYTSNLRRLGWSEDDNTDEDGVMWFDSKEAAMAYLTEVESAIAEV